MAERPVHDHHDAVAREVRSWFTSPVPEIGLDGDQHWFGFLSADRVGRARLVLSVGDAKDVPAALAEARAACPARKLTVIVDDHDRAAGLDAALRQHGCLAQEATTYLALTGPLRSQPGPADLEVTRIGQQDLSSWARVKLQSFADSEEAPSADGLAAEVAIRRAELPLADYQLGSLGGETAAVLAYYHGNDQLVFILGTRIPYRHRGIAQAMLGRWAHAGTAAGCRSLIINAQEGGQPAALYRRLGFVDEVYWYQRYEYTP